MPPRKIRLAQVLAAVAPPYPSLAPPLLSSPGPATCLGVHFVPRGGFLDSITSYNPHNASAGLVRRPRVHIPHLFRQEFGNTAAI